MPQNLGPLQTRVQSWWTPQHQHEPAALDAWLRPARLCGYGCGWQRGRSFEQLVASLRPYLRAGAVDAAADLQRPNVRYGMEVAEALVPKPMGDELALVADLIEAAGAQTVQARNRALAGAAVAALAIAIFFLAND